MEEITTLLRQWREGDPAALERLMPLVYPRLRSIAGSLERQEGVLPSVQATALVNEVYLRLIQQRRLSWDDRQHFFSFAAQVMRMILADHARARLASKRGGKLERIPLHENLPWVSVNHDEVLDLGRALDELAAFDQRKVRVVELRYYLGCTAEEAAEILRISKATVDRDLELARVWLFHRLKGTASAQLP
jgi:RNA polymerase sigma factor (TIGR02999 family)